MVVILLILFLTLQLLHDVEGSHENLGSWDPVFNTDTGLCLEDAVPPSARKWSGPVGRNISTVIASSYWTHHELAMRILVILVRERLGVHVDVYHPYYSEVIPFYMGVAGCNDWDRRTCDDYTPTDPPFHFIFPWYHYMQDSANLELVDVAVQDAEVHRRVVDMGSPGYLVTDTAHVFQHIVDLALNTSNGTLSLDWHRDLRQESAMEYFTPLNQMDIAPALYKTCDHSDIEFLERRGYACNSSVEYHPWRKTGADGSWSEDGAWPQGFTPLYDCDEMPVYVPTVTADLISFGFECRGEGWWIAPPCAERSPGDEWRDRCIVHIDYDATFVTGSLGGTASIPAIFAAVTWWDVMDEYVYNWAIGHYHLDNTPVMVLFSWWAPDASIGLWYTYGSQHSDYYYYEGKSENSLPVSYTKVSFEPSLDAAPEVPWIIANEEMYSLSPEIASLLERFTVSVADMNEMMTTVLEKLSDLGSRQGAKDETACQWLREHRSEWEAWTGADSCWADTYFDEEKGRCSVCPDGTTSNRGSSGIEACIPCRDGLLYDASDGCVACPEGEYANTQEQACVVCPKGTYSIEAGVANCTLCSEGFTTANVGSQSGSACVCVEGSYLPVESTSCAACFEGMVCAVGSNEAVEGLLPQLQPGYWATARKPLEVFRCFDREHCPGGPAETCAEHRDSQAVACGRCASDAYEDSNNDCQQCGDEGLVWVFILAIILAFVLGLMIFVYIVNMDVLQQQHGTITCATVLALTFSGLQTLGIFANLAFAFVDPFKTLFGLLSQLSFDIKALRIGCYFGHDVVLNFLCRQLVAPLVICVTAVVVAFKTRHTGGFLPEWMNTVGSIFSIFFISITVSAVMPGVLYSHPRSVGWSMRSSPSVLTASPEYVKLLMITTATFAFVVLPFTVVVAYGATMYPRLVARSNAKHRLLAMRFLYFRFKPSCFYYASALVSRSLLLCLVPVVIQDEPASQLLAMSVVMMSFLVFQTLTRPWKQDLTNVFDGVLAAGLQIILVFASLSTDMVVSDSTINFMGISLLSFLLLTIIVALLISVHVFLVPRPRYHYFLCHHKADAAAQSRLLKCMMQIRRLDVFIDSDDLLELDSLFDTIRCKVRHVIVYLTRDTLSRSWCAGEIVTARRNKKNTTVVLTSGPTGFTNLTNEELDDLESYIDGGCQILTPFLISIFDVKEAYQWLLGDTLPVERLMESARGRLRFELLVSSLLKETSDVLQDLPQPRKDYLLMSTDPRDNEAIAAASILALVIEQDLLGFAKNGVVLAADLKDPDSAGLISRARAVVVLLTAKTLMSEVQLASIVQSMRLTSHRGTVKKVTVIPVKTEAFQFPGPDFYDVVLPGIWMGDLEEARSLIKEFFRIIAVQFAVGASIEVLAAQSRHVLARVPREAHLSETFIDAPSSHLHPPGKSIQECGVSEHSSIVRDLDAELFGGSASSRACHWVEANSQLLDVAVASDLDTIRSSPSSDDLSTEGLDLLTTDL